MARLTRAEETRLNGLMAKGIWTDADVDALLELTAVEWLRFPAGTRLPQGAFGRFDVLTGLKALTLDDCPVGDAEIASLASAVPGLTRLYLTGTKITDAALATIGRSFPRLEQLHIGQTAITDRGLPFLTSLSRLEYLWVDGTAVTDNGILALAPARRLTGINVKNTSVTPAGEEARFRAWLTASRSPKAVPPDPADVEACHRLLQEFFDAMNAWEREASGYMGIQTQTTEESEKLRDQQLERQRLVAEIFARFLTPRPRQGERDQALTTRLPLTYGTVQFYEAVRVSRNQINIITKDIITKDLFWYNLYACVRTPEGWRIDAKRWLGSGGWERAYF